MGDQGDDDRDEAHDRGEKSRGGRAHPCGPRMDAVVPQSGSASHAHRDRRSVDPERRLVEDVRVVIDGEQSGELNHRKELQVEVVPHPAERRFRVLVLGMQERHEELHTDRQVGDSRVTGQPAQQAGE